MLIHVFFRVGVIASNIVTGILIACKAMGGLSADLYSFDCKYIISLIALLF